MDSEDEIDLLDNEQASKSIRIGKKDSCLYIHSREIQLDKESRPDSKNVYFRPKEEDFLKQKGECIKVTNVEKIAQSIGIYEKNMKKRKCEGEDTFMDFDMSQPIKIYKRTL